MAKVIIKGQKDIEVEAQSEGQLTVDGVAFIHDIISIKPGYYHVIRDNRTFDVELLATDRATGSVSLLVNGKIIEAKVKDKMDLLLERLGMAAVTAKKVNEFRAPMPGLIMEVLVKEGEEVAAGTPLMLLEAMKMENVLKSPGTGTIKAIPVSKGQGVEKNQVLITFS